MATQFLPYDVSEKSDRKHLARRSIRPESGARIQPPLQVDTHLVLNVLNQMAAKNFLHRGEEDPALFALADYLQQALVQRTNATLGDDVRLFETHLKLSALMNIIKLDLHISGIVDLADRPSVPCLFEVISSLLAAVRPQLGSRWRTKFRLEQDRSFASGLRVLLDVVAMADGTRGVEQSVVHADLADIAAARYPTIREFACTLEPPTHFRVEFTVLP